MEENVQVEKVGLVRRKKLCIIILVIVLIAVVGFASWWILRQQKSEDENGIGYESGAVVVTDADELQRMVDDMVKDDSMALEYKNVAVSRDGENFSCYLINSIKNKYEMFLTIYKDQEMKEQLLLTKLIPPGSGMEQFRTEKKLDPGTYDTVLVFTQVKGDHKTIRSQISVAYTMKILE